MKTSQFTNNPPGDYDMRLGTTIDCMLQDDAVGRGYGIKLGEQPSIVVLNLRDPDLTMEKLNAEHDLLLFDGGNTFGDSWKALFHPKERAWAEIGEDPFLEEGAFFALYSPNEADSGCNSGFYDFRNQRWAAEEEDASVLQRHEVVERNRERMPTSLGCDASWMCVDGRITQGIIHDAPRQGSTTTDYVLCTSVGTVLEVLRQRHPGKFPVVDGANGVMYPVGDDMPIDDMPMPIGPAKPGVLVIEPDRSAYERTLLSLFKEAGFHASGEHMPRSGVGEIRHGQPDTSDLHFQAWFQDLGSKIIVFSLKDATEVLGEDEGFQEVEFSGYGWLILDKATGTFECGWYFDDWYHAFGKGRARGYLLRALKDEAGIEQPEDVYGAYVEACKAHFEKEGASSTTTAPTRDAQDTQEA